MSFWLVALVASGFSTPLLKCNFGCLNETISVGRSYSCNNMNVFIDRCLFVRLSSFSGDGGVIYVNTGISNLSIMFTTFETCSVSSSHSGGAIYFNSINSTLDFVCAYGCKAGIYNFARIITSNIDNLTLVTITSCSNNYEGASPILMDGGHQRTSFVNVSLNYNDFVGIFTIDNPSSSSLSFISFSHNRILKNEGFGCYRGSTSLSYANIIHNNSPGSGGIVYASQSATIDLTYCVIYNNENTLFCIGTSGSISISNSYISHNSTLKSGTVSFNSNITYSLIQSYPIEFLGTYLCHANIPAITSEYSQFFTPNQTSDPYPTLHQSLFPQHTPHQSLFPQHTPHQSLFPHHTPFKSFNEFNSSIEVGIVYLFSGICLLTIIAIYLIIKCVTPKKEDKSSSTISEKHEHKANHGISSTNNPYII